MLKVNAKLSIDNIIVNYQYESNIKKLSDIIKNVLLDFKGDSVRILKIKITK